MTDFDRIAVQIFLSRGMKSFSQRKILSGGSTVLCILYSQVSLKSMSRQPINVSLMMIWTNHSRDGNLLKSYFGTDLFTVMVFSCVL